ASSKAPVTPRRPRRLVLGKAGRLHSFAGSGPRPVRACSTGVRAAMSQTEPAAPVPPASGRSWLSATVLGVVLATFLSDFSHEACTAVLPLYLAFIHLGPASLGLIEGLADFLVSLSKLAGGILGHHVKHKRPLAAVGYLLTALA